MAEEKDIPVKEREDGSALVALEQESNPLDDIEDETAKKDNNTSTHTEIDGFGVVMYSQTQLVKLT